MVAFIRDISTVSDTMHRRNCEIDSEQVLQKSPIRYFYAPFCCPTKYSKIAPTRSKVAVVVRCDS